MLVIIKTHLFENTVFIQYYITISCVRFFRQFKTSFVVNRFQYFYAFDFVHRFI